MVAKFFFTFSFFWWSYVLVLPKTVIATEFDFALCGFLGRRDCPCQGLKQACANCLCTQFFLVREVWGAGEGGSMESFISLLVIMKLFLHTDFYAKNETGKFISVIRMVRVTRALICHTIKLKPSPSEFTASCELLFSCVFIVIKTKTNTTNKFSSRLCKSCISKWLDNWVFYLSSCNKPTVSQKRIRRQGFFLRCLISLMFLFISEEIKVEGRSLKTTSSTRVKTTNGLLPGFETKIILS